MTAILYDLTTSPHFSMTKRPPETQPLASTAVSLVGKETECYFLASVALSRPVVELSDRLYLAGEMRRLHRTGPSYRIRNSSYKRLQAIGEVTQMRPGPFSGDAA